MRDGRAEWSVIWRRYRRSDQGGTAQGVQSAYDRAAVEWSVCSVYLNSHKPSLLRSHRTDQAHLVLRTAVAGGPKELHQDRTDSIRGVCTVRGMVEEARRKRESLEDLC